MKENGMELVLDSDVRGVAEFMQRTIPAVKLLAVAEALPQLARLLWENFQQEPIRAAMLQVTCLGRADVQPPNASVLLDSSGVGDGSVAAVASR